MQHIDEGLKLDVFRHGAMVDRYHTWPTIRRQSVGEHSHAVATLALLVEPQASGNLLRAALMHDISECVTGDVPATAKWRWPELKTAVHNASAEFEDHFDIQYDLSEHEQHILSWCDLAELVFWGLEEMKLGNQYGSKLVYRGLEKLLSIKSPNEMAEKLFCTAQKRFSDYKLGIFNNDGE